MNRRERRRLRNASPKAAAAPYGPQFPPGYLDAVRRVAGLLSGLRAAGPRFYLPPKDVRLLGPIETVADVVARDPLSREVLSQAIALVHGDLSPFMFDVACEFADLPVGRVPLSDFTAGRRVEVLK